MHAVIASLRFNPSHLSHLMAVARLLHATGYTLGFRWHANFVGMAGGSIDTTPLTRAQLLRFGPGSVYVLWAPSLAGFLDTLVLRLLRRPVHVLYVFHEPFTAYDSYRASGFSRLKAFKVYLIHIVSKATVAMSDAVVLPSQNALAAFKRRYNGAGKSVQVVPLMFDDEAANGVPTQTERHFVSYIGTVAEDHAFDRFVEFAEQAIQQRLLPGLRFQLATRSVLAVQTTQRLAPFVAAGLMQIQSGRPLTTDEINAAYGNSLVVWNAYKRSMQSGVLPKAYMFGTPVLVSEANPSEFFEPGKHGVQVSSRYDSQELCAAVNSVIANFEQYSAACRASFLEHFHYRANAARFLAALHRAPT